MQESGKIILFAQYISLNIYIYRQNIVNRVIYCLIFECFLLFLLCFISFNFHFFSWQHFRSYHTSFFSCSIIFTRGALSEFVTKRCMSAIVGQVNERSFYKRLHIGLEVFKAVENRKEIYIVLFGDASFISIFNCIRLHVTQNGIKNWIEISQH